jgi:signal transduction histidine kinase/CheY-like chemotaxis protein
MVFKELTTSQNIGCKIGGLKDGSGLHMSVMHWLGSLIDWFTPDSVKDDPHAKKRVRMFLISHLCGPFLGAPIPIFLMIYDPAPFPHVPMLAASIFAFWAFPFALKVFPTHYTSLALLSTVNLSFAILFGSYHYGGASSPFLMWFLVMPLLAFFYLGSSTKTRVIIFAQIALGLAGFYAAFIMADSFPQHIPIEQMVGIGVISAFCAATYVFLMASYYSSVVDSQSELLKEIDRHQDTLKMLTVAKDDAERANGAKSDFLAKMSHELRTPLNAVLGYSEILLEDAELEGRGEQIADLQKISAAGKHLLAMVNDILDISKIEAGKMELNLETVDLDRLIDEVESTGRPLAAKNTNAFIVERGDELGKIRADATKLRQAIFNLLSNAAKFTQNGKITLSARREMRNGAGWIVISVADSGVGISKAQQAQLFSNFSQANPAIAAKYGGTGLGLSLSQNLCRLMGGSISLESEPGKGSRFSISLPTGEAAKPVDDTAMAEAMQDMRSRDEGYTGVAAARPQQTRQEKILIVDDDHDFLEFAERLLMKEGYSPISTDAPESVLQIARTVKPRAILMDILMPGLDGWDVIQTLRSDPVTAGIPVIMLSVMEDRQTARDRGAVDLITKPLDSNKLRAALHALKFGENRPSDRPSPTALAS